MYQNHLEMRWRRLDGRRIEEPIEVEVERILKKEREENNRLKVYIGSDSQVRGRIIEFATVIVFLREKSGGFMLISNETQKGRIGLRERLLHEVTRSVQIAYRLCKLLDRYKIDLEVHADINTNPQFRSNATLQDAMGYIVGMGFTFKAKPEAFASTSCANKVC